MRTAKLHFVQLNKIRSQRAAAHFACEANLAQLAAFSSPQGEFSSGGRWIREPPKIETRTSGFQLPQNACCLQNPIAKCAFCIRWSLTSFLHQSKRALLSKCSLLGGGRWIRTTEGIASRFTVCPLWPLGNSSIFTFAVDWVELVDGFEPPTC